jgi:hypothetical protein
MRGGFSDTRSAQTVSVEYEDDSNSNTIFARSLMKAG